ncbi:MAG: Hpt domain-containing protein [Deltaproteobacteria bacterium]|jgi:chemotaxis protein histidine kinase CheA|nr:Hpt domain-containing protein [Deltaproteobacteria bacterium]
MASELLEEFIFDSREHLATAGAQLLELEKNPDSLTTLNALLGTLHTIKGNSGFVDLKSLYGTLHAAENLLQTIRDTPDHLCPPNIINQLFQVLDTIEAILNRLENDHDDEVDWLPALNQAIAEAQASLELELSSQESAEIAPVSSPQIEDSQAPQEATEQSPSESASYDVGLAEPFRSVKLHDGQISDEHLAVIDRTTKLFQKGMKGLILDLGDLTTFTAKEMRVLLEINRIADGRMAIILDAQEKPDFWRLFQLWGVEEKFKFFPAHQEALASLGGS